MAHVIPFALSEINLKKRQFHNIYVNLKNKSALKIFESSYFLLFKKTCLNFDLELGHVITKLLCSLENDYA